MPFDTCPETRRIRLLAELTRKLAHPVDLPGLRERVLRAGAELVGAVAGTVRLLDSTGGLVLAYGFGLPHGFEDRYPTLPVGGGAMVMALETDGPLSLGSEAATPDLVGPGPDARGYILVRIAVGGSVLGLITLVTPGPGELAEPDFLTLQSLAEILGVGEVNARNYSELERASRTDALTGLSTRRYFEEVFRRELSRARRHARPLSLAILDIDRLKWINDTWGHVVGDRVIAEVGQLLHEVRNTDLAARFGGDEFVLLMPDTSQRDAERVCERLRGRLRQINDAGRYPFPVQVSIGIRELSANDEEDLIAAADAAMYRDKHAGAPEPLTPEPDADEEADVENRCAG